MFLNKEHQSLYCPNCKEYTLHKKIDNYNFECDECGRYIN